MQFFSSSGIYTTSLDELKFYAKCWLWHSDWIFDVWLQTAFIPQVSLSPFYPTSGQALRSAHSFHFGTRGKFQPHEPQPGHAGPSSQPDSLSNFNKTLGQTPLSALLGHCQASLVASLPFPFCSLLEIWHRIICFNFPTRPCPAWEGWSQHQENLCPCHRQGLSSKWRRRICLFVCLFKFTVLFLCDFF